jgi:hypothetical protein
MFLRIGVSGVSVREAHVRGAGGFNHDSIVRPGGEITCKTGESFWLLGSGD